MSTPTKPTADSPISLLDHLLHCADGDSRLREPLINIECTPAGIELEHPEVSFRMAEAIRSARDKFSKSFLAGSPDFFTLFKELGWTIGVAACLAEESRRICPRVVAPGESTAAAIKNARDEAHYMLRSNVDLAEAAERHFMSRSMLKSKCEHGVTMDVSEEELREELRIATGLRIRPASQLHLWAELPKTDNGRIEFVAALTDIVEQLLGKPVEVGAAEVPTAGDRETPAADTTATAVNPPPPPAEDAIPEWITKNFCQKQYTLLRLLWGKGRVAEKELLNAVRNQSGVDPSEAFRKLVTRTNKALITKMPKINSLWQIREMTRDDVKYRSLESD